MIRHFQTFLLSPVSALFTALVAGTIFGLGLTISQMVNPAKVLSFLDVFGDWDPSLAFVMGGAMIVTTIGYRVILKNHRPLAAKRFQIPASKPVDSRLATGSILFGAGWGLVGLCPGPAISAITIGGVPVLMFIVSMGAGVLLFELVNTRLLTPEKGSLKNNSAQHSA